MMLVVRSTLVAVALCATGTAFAQRMPGMPTVPTAAQQAWPTGEHGLKVGSGRLHPFLQLDAQFIANPGYLNENAPNDLALVARPGVELLLPSDKLDLSFRGDLSYRQFVGLQREGTRQLSALEGHAGLDANINKQGVVGFRFSENFVRSADPANQTVTERLLRISNDVGVGLDVRPGGGALVFSANYGLFYERYDREFSAAQDLDNMRHRPGLNISWKFLPKTSVFFNAQADLTRYTTDANPSSNFVFTYLGASGSITQRIALLVKAGYGNSFIEGDDNFNSFAGQAEFNYLASETMRFRLGIVRTAQPTSLFKYFTMNRAYLGYNQALTGRVQFVGILSYNDLRYGDPVQGPPADRVDGQVVADLALSWQATEWMTVILSDKVDWRTSNFTPSLGTNVGYFNNLLMLRIGFRY